MMAAWKAGRVVFRNPLDLASLDFEKTVGKCISPHSTVDRFYAKVILTPTILALATALLAPPLWNLLRRRLPAKLWNKLQAPPRATCVHVRRALLNVCRRPAQFPTPQPSLGVRASGLDLEVDCPMHVGLSGSGHAT